MTTKATSKTEQLLTLKQVAMQLAISQQSVWRLVKQGHLAKVNVGGSVRYRQSDVDEIASHGTWP